MDRSHAAALGLKRYDSDKPCRRGHTSERYVSTGGCIECLNKPYGLTVRVSYDLHHEDRKQVDAYVLALQLQRGEVESPEQIQRTRDEVRYRRAIVNYRKAGCPEEHLPRSLGTFVLPDGEMP